MTEVSKILKKVVDQVPGFKASAEISFCTPQMVEEQWEHRDFPRMSRVAWESIMLLISGHCAQLTSARYKTGEMRGQVLVSPAGIQLMRDRATEQ